MKSKCFANNLSLFTIILDKVKFYAALMWSVSIPHLIAE